MKKPVLVIMAAGMGSRYGGMKQIDPVDEYGHIIVDFSIYDAIKAGFQKIVFIIKKEISSQRTKSRGTTLICVHRTPHLLNAQLRFFLTIQKNSSGAIFIPLSLRISTSHPLSVSSSGTTLSVLTFT